MKDGEGGEHTQDCWVKKVPSAYSASSKGRGLGSSPLGLFPVLVTALGVVAAGLLPGGSCR